MQVDVEILVYAVIAALFLGRLWAVLGTRNENDPQRLNPFASPPPAPNDDAAARQIVSRLQSSGPPPMSLAGGLAQIKALIPTFDEKQFLQEARDIFSSVVGAYASGHLALVTEFLSPGILGSFQQSVNARKALGQTAQTRIAKFRESEVRAARVEGQQAYVTVTFVTEQENVLRDAQRNVVGGAEGQYEQVADTWTFARDAQQSAAKWVVVETRA
jgi:predicted lipid-binding transport protein (Tim44 family)